MVVIEKNSTAIGSLEMKELGWDKGKGSASLKPEEKKEKKAAATQLIDVCDEER